MRYILLIWMLCVPAFVSAVDNKAASMDESSADSYGTLDPEQELMLLDSEVNSDFKDTAAMADAELAMLQGTIEDGVANAPSFIAQQQELLYIVILSSLCVVTLFMVLYFLKQREYEARDVVSVAGLIVIVFGTIILVLIVDTTEQLTAAIGILGAIAGYLFRSAQERERVPSGVKAS